MPGKYRARGKIAEAILAARPAGVVRPYLMFAHQVGPFYLYTLLYHLKETLNATVKANILKRSIHDNLFLEFLKVRKFLGPFCIGVFF